MSKSIQYGVYMTLASEVQSCPNMTMRCFYTLRVTIDKNTGLIHSVQNVQDYLINCLNSAVFNRPFARCLLLVSGRFFVQNHSYERVFRLQVTFHPSQRQFPYEKFWTRACFDTEAQGTRKTQTDQSHSTQTTH